MQGAIELSASERVAAERIAELSQTEEGRTTLQQLLSYARTYAAQVHALAPLFCPRLVGRRLRNAVLARQLTTDPH